MLEERLAAIAGLGVPNYFGPQRFGRDGQNIELCRQLLAGRRLTRHKRGIALSAGRALLFNAILDQRIAAATWNRILPGERANLDGTNSVFAVTDVDEELEKRCAAFDIHPSGTLWGREGSVASADVAGLEAATVAAYPDIAEGLQDADIEAGQRALRIRVGDLQWSIDGTLCWLEFKLIRGAFATAVLREIVIARMAAALG